MPKTILIVDDDPEIRSYLSDILTDAGYAVLTAESGEEALPIIEKGGFDLMTLDIEMPNVSGPWLTRVLEKKGQAGTFPIIVITGQPDLKYSIPGAVAQFDKPFVPAEVQAKVKEILGE